VTFKTLEDIAKTIAGAGLICRGGFHPRDGDDVPAPAGTVVLIGNAGPAMWRAFTDQVAPEEKVATANPLDDWIRRILTKAARQMNAQPLFPFEGPPYYPFSKWAKRAEAVFTSPMGPLIHPEYGLWHAYRGALLFHEVLPLPTRIHGENPCERCETKPCLRTCPVDAIRVDGYDTAACTRHLHTDAGIDCMLLSCRARRACPVGRQHQYEPDQSLLHMRGFLSLRNK
jgi:ferredoxin